MALPGWGADGRRGEGRFEGGWDGPLDLHVVTGEFRVCENAWGPAYVGALSSASITRGSRGSHVCGQKPGGASPPAPGGSVPLDRCQFRGYRNIRTPRF